MGVSIFGIWDGYRMLIDGRAKELPSPIKIKVETGEIFKFTAIQKLNKEGAVTGIIEVALDASKSIQTMLQNQIEQNSQLEAVSFGKEKPAVEGRSEDAFAQNRRVEINYR